MPSIASRFPTRDGLSAKRGSSRSRSSPSAAHSRSKMLWVEAAMEDSLRAYLRDQYTPEAIEVYLRTLRAMGKRRDGEKERRMLAG